MAPEFYLTNQLYSAASLLLNTLNKQNQTRCQQQLANVASAAMRNELWALSVFDSLGKPRSGLMRGSIFNLVGDQDQCQDQANFKYCQAQVNLDGSSGTNSFFRPIVGAPKLLKWGLCVPRVCSADELGALVKHLLPATTLTGLDCCASTSALETVGNAWPLATWLSLLVLVALVALVTAASLLDNDEEQRLKYKQRQKQTCSRNAGRLSSFIEAFSLLQTTRRLLLEPTTASSLATRKLALDLRPLDGLRVLSTLWIIAVHSYSFAFQWLLFDNLDSVDNVYKSVWSQWLGNGTFALDNFLLISGLLAHLNSRDEPGRIGSAKCLDEAKSKTNNNWKSLLIRRHLRLAPTLALLILLSLGLLPYLSRGPQWAAGTRMFDEWCRPGPSWALNLILAHNLINTSQMCFSHSWYVGVDFQLFALLQLVLWLHKGGLLNLKCSLVVLIGAAQLSVACLVYANNLTYLPQLPAESMQSILVFQSKLYIKPHHWLASFFLGVLLAVHLLERRPRRGINNANWFQLLIPTSTMFALILISLPYFRANLRMSPLQSSAIALLARPLWGLSLAWLLCGLLRTPRGARKESLARRRSPAHILKLAHQTLSSDVWRPLSRISYPAYLLHPPLMAAFYASRNQTFQFSHSLLLYFTLGNTVLTYAGALALHLLLEAPASHMARRLRPELAPTTRSRRSSQLIELQSKVAPPPVQGSQSWIGSRLIDN